MNVVDRAGLLERALELAALARLVAATAAGTAGVGVIEGAAGIGKSRLLSEARRDADAAGLRILRARGGELEREFAFGVVRQLFEPVLLGNEDALFAGAAAMPRARLRPASRR